MEPDEAVDTGESYEPSTTQEAPSPPQMEGVPTGDDNSPGVPSAGQGDNGEMPQQEEQPKRFGPLGRIVSYLMGEGAAHPQVLKQEGAAVDPQGQMSHSDRNVLAVEKAQQEGGPQAAWQLVQANRVAYNAKQAFAYAALNGNQQKPPDINAAVDAANQAADHILDGSNVHFMASTSGQITATVKGPSDEQPQVFDLTPDQFRKYLNVGGAGQWDRQMQGGVKATLTSLSAENQQQQRGAAVAQRSAGMAQRAAPQENVQREAQDQTTRRGGSNSFNMRSAGEEEYDPSLVRKAWGMFPGAGSSQERAQWLAQQEEKEDVLQNKIDVEKERGSNWVSRTEAQNQGHVATQQEKNKGGLAVQQERTKGWQYASDAKKAAAQISADQKAAHDGNVDARARLESGRKAIATKRMTATALTPDEEAFEKQLTQRPQQGAPQQQAPQQRSQAAPASPGQPPVQGARFYKGQWYTRGPNGEAVPYQQ